MKITNYDDGINNEKKESENHIRNIEKLNADIDLKEQEKNKVKKELEKSEKLLLDIKSSNKSNVLSTSQWKRKEKIMKKHSILNQSYSKLQDEIEIKIKQIRLIEEKIQLHELELEKFVNAIDSKVNEVLSYEKIQTLLTNYLKQFFQKEIFLNLENLKKFEYTLFKLYPMGLKILNFNKEEYFQDYNEDMYDLEDFLMLSRLINNFVDFQSKESSLYCIWKSLNILAIKYYSQMWVDNFGKHYKNIQNISLEECIKIYCEIDYIEEPNISSRLHFFYFLIDNNKLNHVNKLKINIISEYKLFNNIFQNISNKIAGQNKYSRFVNKLYLTERKYVPSVNDIDLMDGYEFEKFISSLFAKMGYKTEVTKGSGDQGIDVIAEKKGKKVGIQTKCYSGKVTNKSVQEVVAGLSYYNCEKGIVITNSYFTDSALNLAESNGVVLWNRDMLKIKIEEVFDR